MRFLRACPLCFYTPPSGRRRPKCPLCFRAAIIVPGELTKLFPDIDGEEEFPPQIVSMRQVRAECHRGSGTFKLEALRRRDYAVGK